MLTESIIVQSKDTKRISGSRAVMRKVPERLQEQRSSILPVKRTECRQHGKVRLMKKQYACIQDKRHTFTRKWGWKFLDEVGNVTQRKRPLHYSRLLLDARLGAPATVGSLRDFADLKLLDRLTQPCKPTWSALGAST